MASYEHKKFASPDETRTFEKGKLELIRLDGATVGRLTVEPGWRWSAHVKPLVKTELCEVHHVAYQISGRLHILMADGSEFELGPGEVIDLPPGHDAWVVGEEPAVFLDWQGYSAAARQ